MRPCLQDQSQGAALLLYVPINSEGRDTALLPLDGEMIERDEGSKGLVSIRREDDVEFPGRVTTSLCGPKFPVSTTKKQNDGLPNSTNMLYGEEQSANSAWAPYGRWFLVAVCRASDEYSTYMT